MGIEGTVLACSAKDLMSALDERSVGAVITDPPFFTSTGRAESWYEQLGMGKDPWVPEITSTDQAIEWSMWHIYELYRIIRPGGAFVTMGGTQSIAAWTVAAEKAGFQWMAELVVLWNQGKPRARSFGSLHTNIVWFLRPGNRHAFNYERRTVYSNVIVCDKIPPKRRQHPSEKPVALTNFLISLLTREDDLVLDPFCGSGSTLVSAAQCGRRWLGCDVDERHARTAVRRAQQHELEEPGFIALWTNGRLQEV